MAKLRSKLKNPDTALKIYWSIINKILNNKKIPTIPLLCSEIKLISDCEKKGELFNNHYASHCSLVKNASTLIMKIQ